VIVDKDFADAAVRKPRDGRAITKSFNLKIEGLRRAPVWQTLAHECRPAGKSVAAGFLS
jgi:hypothetical protein